MDEQQTPRLSRLTAILTQLQAKRLVTAPELASKFQVSVRTIYRDIRALEEAGIPILTEEGKGYSLLEGYRLPPVMFTESEANALITAEQLILRNKDASLVKEYQLAISKIRSVLRYSMKDKVDLLSSRVVFRVNAAQERTSNYLSDIQLALTNFNLINISYYSPVTEETTVRIIEPFALYSTEENWIVIAWCRLRFEYRAFRLDRILAAELMTETFEKHTITLEEYVELCKTNTKPLT